MYTTCNILREIGPSLKHSPSTKRIAVSLFHSGMTCQAVSQILHAEFGVIVSPSSVALWARAAGGWRRRGGKRLPLPGTEMRKAYDAGTSVRELALEYHVSQRLVRKRLHEAGTRMRAGGTVYPILTLELLRDLYVSQGVTARMIAARVGCSETTVTWRLRTYGIPRRGNQRYRDATSEDRNR